MQNVLGIAKQFLATVGKRDSTRGHSHCPSDLWATLTDRLNAAYPQNCRLTPEDWEQLDEIEVLIASAAASGDLVALGAELDAYERTAREIFRKRRADKPSPPLDGTVCSLSRWAAFRWEDGLHPRMFDWNRAVLTARQAKPRRDDDD